MQRSKLVFTVAAAIASQAVSQAALAVTQWNFEDGTTQQWGTSFSTPSWQNLAVGSVGATDGGQAFNFNIPNAFTFGSESNTRPTGLGAATPEEGARWDAFAASNLLLVDLSATGTNAPEGPSGDALRAQYVVMYPAFNGRGPASDLPSVDGSGQKTYTFISSYDRPIDFENGSTARYQTNFAPGYFSGVRTHTVAWDYVAAGYDFSKLTPTNDDQNYTLLHFTSNTDAANPYTGRMGMDNIRVYRAKQTDPTYNGTAAGTFTASNFANNFVSGTGAIAIFKHSEGVEAATVTVTAPTTVGTLMLNNTPRSVLGAPIAGAPTSYTFAGASTLTIDNGTAEAAIVAVDGNNVISAPLAINSNAVIDLAADVSQDGAPQAPATLGVANVTLAAGKTLRTTSVGTLTINGDLTGGAGSALRINGGRTRLGGSGSQIVVSDLTISTSAQLDLDRGSAIVDYTGTSPLEALTAAIRNGNAGGLQTGAGIISSVATAKEAVGIAEASSIVLPGNNFLGTTVDVSAVLLRFTLRGDADLSGNVNFADLVSLAQNYNGTGKSWRQGDANYDGNVNFADLVALAQNYNQSVTAGQLALLGESFAGEFARAQSVVPEPVSIAGLGLLSAVLIRRRR